jgi:hypothetical protein
MIIIILSGRALQQFDLGVLVCLIDGFDELILEDVLWQLCVAVDEIRDDAEDVVEQNDADDLADDEDGEVDMRPAVLDFVGQTVEG